MSIAKSDSSRWLRQFLPSTRGHSGKPKIELISLLRFTKFTHVHKRTVTADVRHAR